MGRFFSPLYWEPSETFISVIQMVNVVTRNGIDMSVRKNVRQYCIND